jgi:hypothetical protein
MSSRDYNVQTFQQGSSTAGPHLGRIVPPILYRERELETNASETRATCIISATS